MFIARSTLGYIATYLVLLIPTYLLPWLGSNSAVVNALGAAIGWGMTPQWWAHVWCLGMLILLTHLRGGLIGKNFLITFPVFAAVFDLTPILSMIPLVPTVLHLLALVLGAMTASRTSPEANGSSSGLPTTTRKAGIFAGGMTVAAIAGSLLFVSTATRGVPSVAEKKTNVTLPAALANQPAAAPSRPTPQPPEQARASSPVMATASVPASPKPPSIKVTQNALAALAAPAASARVRYININD